MSGHPSDVGRLLISSEDGPGIVATVTAFLYARGANIISSDQMSTDPVGGRFFQRIEFHLPDLLTWVDVLEREFADEVAGRFGMWFRISHRDAVAQITGRGADVERLVLARTVRWHCEDRVLLDGHTTVVF